MKYIKTYENTKYNVGDYINFAPTAFDTDAVYSCVKIIKTWSQGEDEYKVKILLRDNDDDGYFLNNSFLFESEIKGYASTEEIEFFKLYENLKKYNL